MLAALAVSAAAIGSVGSVQSGSAFCPASAVPDDGVDWDALEAAALDDGSFVWYSPIPQETAQAILDDFSEAYPDLDVTLVQQGPGPLIERLLADFSRDDVQADVISLTSYPQLADLEATGALEEFVPENASALREDARLAEPAGIGSYLNVTAWAWSTELPDEVQQRFEEGDWSMFGDPEVADALRGRVASLDPALTGSGLSAHLGLQQLLGDEAYEEFLANFAALEPTLYESNGPASESLASGESLAFFGIQGFAIALVEEGVDIRTGFFKPTPTYVSYTELVAGAPHPNAAKLFMTWLLSVPGQESLMEHYDVQSARNDVEDNRGHTTAEWFEESNHDPAELGLITPEFMDQVDDQAFLDHFADVIGG